LLTELGYNYLKSLGDSSAKYYRLSLGANHNLSKRTDVYSVVSYHHANGQYGAGQAHAVIGSLDVDSGKNSQMIATVGLRHRF
jgi:predicted porin